MKSLALALLLLPGAAFAGPWYELVNGTMSLTGVLGIAASSSTPKNYVLLLNGRDGYIQFPDGTKQNTAATAGLNYYASTGTFTGTNTFSHTIIGSITGSAGSVPASGVDLSTVTMALAGKLTAPATFYIVKPSDYLVAPASFTYQAQGNYITSLTGGVTASGPGAAAATVVSVPQSAVNLSTVTTALAGKLSNTATVPTSLIDLSTVTTALAGKQATGNYITALTGNVTASGPGSAAATIVSVPPSAVDLSTVTTALSGKQATGNYITALTGNVTASGPGSAAATIVSVPQSAVNLSTVTTALASKANASDVIPSTATGTYALSTTGRAALATSADNATTVTNGAYVNASNYFTGVNQFVQNTTISNKLYVDEIQLSSAVPSIKAYDGVSIKNILMYPGVEINASPGYAYNWILASTDSLKMKYYDAGPDVGQYFKYDKYGLVTSSGIRAGASRVDGSGGVNIIGSDGRIPALTSTYIANLDGTAITGVTDATKVAKAGDTMSGQLTVNGSSITIASDLLDYQLILTGANKRNIKLDDRHASASTHNLAEIDFLQLGTIKHQISAYGDTNATYPQELQLGSPSGTASKVRITGSATLNPDIFVSSFGSVGINTAAPNAAYKLDVNGNVRASGFTGDGSQLTGITGTGAQALLNSTNTWTSTQNLLNETNFNIGTGGGIGFQNYTGTDYGGIAYQGGINYLFGGPAQLGAALLSKAAGTSLVVRDEGVGIKDTSPSYALDVNGGIRATSTMTASAYYGDGSTLTGVVTLPSTQTFTGINTFQGATAANPAATHFPEYVFVSSRPLNGSFDASLSIPSGMSTSSCSFKVNFDVVASTYTAYWGVTFNGVANNYFVYNEFTIEGNGTGYQTATAQDLGYISGNSPYYTIANGFVRGSIEFDVIPQAPANTYAGLTQTIGKHQGCATVVCRANASFQYYDGNPITSVRISNTQGTTGNAPDNLLPIYGWISLYKKGYCR